MGTWATGLYAGDFASDLRGTVGAVCRLPFEADSLLELLCQAESASADPEDEDYCNFWLVVADQFYKRGLVSERARERALKIIDEGWDVALWAELGCEGPDLRKRASVLDELRARLVGPQPPARSRTTLKKPQALVMQAGDLYAYPTSHGQCINPYFASTAEEPGWQKDGWGAVLIAEVGHAFGFLAWYRPVVALKTWAEKPQLPQLRDQILWALRSPGTLSALHLRRLQLDLLGHLRVKQEVIVTAAPCSGIYAAINDISLANGLNASAEAYGGLKCLSHWTQF